MPPIRSLKRLVPLLLEEQGRPKRATKPILKAAPNTTGTTTTKRKPTKKRVNTTKLVPKREEMPKVLLVITPI